MRIKTIKKIFIKIIDNELKEKTMDLKTGKIYETESIGKKIIEKVLGRKLVELTDEQAKKLKPLSKRKRKTMLKGWPCVCGSKKSFKKCCSRKYK